MAKKDRPDVKLLQSIMDCVGEAGSPEELTKLNDDLEKMINQKQCRRRNKFADCPDIPNEKDCGHMTSCYF